VVANCAVLTECFDEPSVDCVIVARPTRSRILYVQMIGRGTRTFPNKRDCLIIDLVGATERHDLLTLPQLFGLGGAGALEDRTFTEALEREPAAAGAATPEAPLVAEEVDLFPEHAKLRWVEVGERWALTTGRGLVFTQPRSPGRYVSRSRFATTPSRPRSQTAANSASPSSKVATSRTCLLSSSSSSSNARRSEYGCIAVDTPSTASTSNTNNVRAMPGRPGRTRDERRWKSGRPSSPSATSSPSSWTLSGRLRRNSGRS
jgi:hypothetical protein